ncbi:hypothetical protein ACH4U3_42715 [Streptomyces griseoruber]|uniref:hypothetical protein n=1 Tax=Streptomyces griseoruber TaxID=1943 RepID=UPI0037987C13
MTERASTWQELLAAAAEVRTPPAFRKALRGLREDGPTFERLTAIGHEIVGRRHASGFTSGGPSMSAWKKLVAADGKDMAGLPAWKYVELLILAYAKHHDLPEDEATRLLFEWADCYTACGGQPRPQYRRVTEPPPEARPGARRRGRPLYVIGAVTATIALTAATTYALWDKDQEPPLSVDDVSYLGLSTGDYVFPSVMKLSDSEVQKLEKEDYGKGRTFEEWFTQNGGVPAHFRTVSLTVSGRTEKQLRITNMELQKQDCAPPPTGTLFLNGGTNGGESKTKPLFFKLDDQVPEPTDENGDPYFARKSITLKHEETETIVAFVSTNRLSCGFTFRFTVVVPGRKPVKQVVSDGGKPFRLNAPADSAGEHPYSRYRVMYVGGVAAPAGAGIVRADPKTYNGDSQTLTVP